MKTQLAQPEAHINPPEFQEYTPPEPPTLDELYAKISGFPEVAQMDNLPMLSKASCLAQIASARALERIAGILERIAGAFESL